MMLADEILLWLREEEKSRLQKLLKMADEIRKQNVGDEVHLRGLVEFSNICVRSCTYCGIRAGNAKMIRYRMTREEILSCADQAHRFGCGTIVLQSGEDISLSAEWLGDIVREIKERYPLAITLMLGEKSEKEYRYWFEQGANRYLLKFETSDDDLYRRIHPPRKEKLPDRLELLKILKKIGYQTGSGIMVGIPGQTYKSLAHDILLFAEYDLDMIGIGPYIPHPETPMAQDIRNRKILTEDQAPNDELTTLKVLALARLVCPQANIPATTALATVDPEGHLKGLRSGANVIMPNLTPMSYRRLYEIYPKPVLLAAEQIHAKVIAAVKAADRKLGQGRGDRNH